MTSKFLEEKKYLINNVVEYKNGICCTKFKDLKLTNIVYFEEVLDTLSNKMFFSTSQGILKFLKKHEDIDFIETGEIKIKNIDDLKQLLSYGNVLCELTLSPSFFRLKYKFGVFFSNEKKVQYLSSLLQKDIIYYEKDKKVCCFIY